MRSFCPPDYRSGHANTGMLMPAALAVALLASACSDAGPPVDENKYVDVQIELHLIEARPGTEADHVALRTRVLAEYGMSEHELDAARRYYAENVEDYVAVYERIIDRLTEERARLGTNG